MTQPRPDRSTTVIELDPARAGEAFPRIHEGRYEVDPWASSLHPPLADGLVDAVRRCGIKLLRIGIGCWLPGHDPHPSTLGEREWFLGATLDDVDDPSQFNFTHLDRNLDVCLELDVDLLFCFDYMPRSLARPGPPKDVIDSIKPYAPPGYQFPDGVRDAPTKFGDVFGAAAVKVLEHIRERGVVVRYVELWNEPDLPFFYAGDYDEYFPMYEAFAHAVKAAGYAVGGPSWAGALESEEWLDRFLHDCSSKGTPLDFYSFHRYSDEVDAITDRCRQIRAALDAAGFIDTLAVIDEWGYDLRDAPYFGTVGNAAFTASCLMQMPALGVAAQTHVLLVDPIKLPEFGRFHGLTDSVGDANPIAFCIEAFERFQRTPLRIPTAADDTVLAGNDAEHNHVQVIITNPDKQAAHQFLLTAPGRIEGQLSYLTAESYASGGWSKERAITIAGDGLVVNVPHESMARLEGKFTAP